MEIGYSKYDLENNTEETSVEARKRFYTYSVVSYANRKEIQPLLDSAEEWAFMLHDKDVDSDGNPLGTHFHIMLSYQQNQTYRKLAKIVVSKQNTFIQGLKGVVGNLLDYFTHEGKPNKYQYDPEEIVYSDKEYWMKRLGWKSSFDKSELASNENFVEYLLSAEFEEVECARKFGRDFIKNRDKYITFRNAHINNDLTELQRDFKTLNEISDLKFQIVVAEQERSSAMEKYIKKQRECEEQTKEINNLYKIIEQLNNDISTLEQERDIYKNIILNKGGTTYSAERKKI